MRILHISDFHYRSNKNKFEQTHIIEKLCNQLSKKEKIDFILFTGDIVHSGSNSKDFQEAHDLLLKAVSTKLNVQSENIFICAGNHDINRDECSEAIITFLDNKIENNKDLNDYVSKKDNKDYKNSLAPIANFNNYHIANFSFENTVHSELYSTHKRTHDNKSIGITVLNSAWLSSGIEGRKDINNLLIPSDVAKNATIKIKDCDIKILLVHHPLADLREFNYIEIQDLIHSEYNLMFSGHVHREHISTQYRASNGIYCNSSQATLTFDAEGEIGYSVINIDVNDLSSLKLDRATYLKKEKEFLDIESVVIQIPCGEEKHKQNKFRHKITSKYAVELKNANTLLLDYDETKSRNFVELFSPPVISNYSEAESNTTDKKGAIDFEKILYSETNYLIFGKDKCGKTSLLKFLQLDYLKNYSTFGAIPFYIDYKDYENLDKSFDIIKNVGHYYEVNFTHAENLTTTKKFVFLIDNFDAQNPIHPVILQFLEEHKDARFVICSDDITSRIYMEALDDLEYDKVFFKNLTRKEIRIYTEKQHQIKSSDREAVLEKITHMCAQLKLPLNYWMISLILLIYKKSNDDYSKNLFSVLDLCVDEILNKKQLLLNKNKLTFDQYKELCGKIAFFLLKDHKATVYAAEAHEIITFIVECKQTNPRLSGDAKDIFDFLYQCGVFKTKGSRYTFRLNGLFEYFLSFHIKDNGSIKKEILKNDALYLSFKNELEIYSGFNNKDRDFLDDVFKKTKLMFDPIIDKYISTGGFDKNLVSKIGEANDFGRLIKKLTVKNPLSNSQKDLLLDQHEPLISNSDVQLKEPTVLDKVDFELLEKYLTILSRVFKNSDGIEDVSFVNEILDFVINAYCSIGFILVEELEAQAKEENLKHKDELDDNIIGEEMLKMVSRIIPVLVQVMLHDGIGHNNFKEILLSKINDLNKNNKENQYKLFLLYFLVVDIDLKSNKDLVDEIFKNVTLSALKVSTIFKLNFYLAFKAYKDKNLEAYVRQKLQEGHLKIDKDLDVADLQRSLSKKQKKNILKKKNR